MKKAPKGILGKWLGISLVIVLASGFTVSASEVQAAAADDIRVVVNGTQIQFDQQPIVYDERVMVPIRPVAEALDYEVSQNTNGGVFRIHMQWLIGGSGNNPWWSPSATVYPEGAHLTAGVPGAYYNNLQSMEAQIIVLDPAPRTINGRTLIGIRDIATILDADISWNGETRTVTISKELRPLNETGRALRTQRMQS